MRCASARKLISESLDEAPRAARAAALKEHLAACPDCRSFAGDLESIVREAGRLPALEPSGRVWPSIAAGVRASKAVETAPSGFAVRWRFALAAASSLIILGAGLIIGLQHRRTAGAGERGSVEFAMAKLKEAQAYYEKAIGALSEAVRSQENALAPELAEVFERNLEGLDQTIQVCRQMVTRSPDDPTVRAYLLTAYREKVSLFEEIMGLGPSSGAKTKAATL
jgi:predicted anti-sigma-YlaC factor YlaD